MQADPVATVSWIADPDATTLMSRHANAQLEEESRECR
jgi:hypothetical protein